MSRVEKECSLSNVNLFFYSVYASEFNKETIQTLKREFTLPAFLDHKQFIEIQEDLRQESYEDSKKG